MSDDIARSHPLSELCNLITITPLVAPLRYYQRFAMCATKVGKASQHAGRLTRDSILSATRMITPRFGAGRKEKFKIDIVPSQVGVAISHPIIGRVASVPNEIKDYLYVRESGCIKVIS